MAAGGSVPGGENPRRADRASFEVGALITGGLLNLQPISFAKMPDVLSCQAHGTLKSMQIDLTSRELGTLPQRSRTLATQGYCFSQIALWAAAAAVAGCDLLARPVKGHRSLLMSLAGVGAGVAVLWFGRLDDPPPALLRAMNRGELDNRAWAPRRWRPFPLWPFAKRSFRQAPSSTQPQLRTQSMQWPPKTPTSTSCCA